MPDTLYAKDNEFFIARDQRTAGHDDLTHDFITMPNDYVHITAVPIKHILAQ